MSTVTMNCRVSELHEVDERTEEERARDSVAPRKIDYADLFFTLKRDPSKYCPPIVRVENGRLVAFGNIAFLKAAREAGISELTIEIDSNGKPLPLEQLMERHGLEMPKAPKRREWVNRFYFFEHTPKVVPGDVVLGSLREFVKPHPDIMSKEYLMGDCQGYELKVCGKFQEVNEREQKLIGILSRLNGKIRSVDGILRGAAAEEGYSNPRFQF